MATNPTASHWTLDAAHAGFTALDDHANHAFVGNTPAAENRQSGGAFPVSAAPQRTDWMTDAVLQFDAIERLPDGWDSHGSNRPDKRILHSARALLDSLVKADEELAKPHIHPTPSGGVQFHWESGRRYFEIEVVDPQSAVFYFVDPDLQTEIEGHLRVGDPLGEVSGYAQHG